MKAGSDLELFAILLGVAIIALWIGYILMNIVVPAFFVNPII